MNRKIPLFILMGCAIVAGLTYSIYSSVQTHKQLTAEISNSQVAVNNKSSSTTTVSTSNSQPNKSQTSTSSLKTATSNQSSLPTLTQGMALSIENDVRSSFRKFNFNEGVGKATKALSQYKDSDTAKTVKQLQAEGNLLANLKGLKGVGVNNILSNIKDPENYLLGVLALDKDAREKVILAYDSLNPVFNGGADILDKSVLTSGDTYNDIQAQHPDLKQVLKIQFRLESNPLVAYLIQFPDGSLKLYEIIGDGHYIPPYITIKQWQEIRANQDRSSSTSSTTSTPTNS